MKKVLLTAAVFLAVAAPAFAAGDVCLMHRNVDGWGNHGDHAVVVNDKFGKKYLLSLAGSCSDINFAFGVGIRSPIGENGDSCVERGDKIVMRGGGVIGRNDACWITKVELYTPEMEKAYHDAVEAKRHDHN